MTISPKESVRPVRRIHCPAGRLLSVDVTQGRRPRSRTALWVILPKLFRRLAEFLDGGGTVSGFKQFLANRVEGVTIISSTHFTHFDNVVTVEGDVVRLTELPENLMFEG
jgi:hypothetical protein